MPLVRRQQLSSSESPLPSIADPPVGADITALRNKTIEILQALRNRQILATEIASSLYYQTLQAFNPWALLRLEETTANVEDDAGATIGTYSGTYLQRQPSLLSDNAGASVRFNNGAIALTQQIAAPPSYTLICRFVATSTATGGFFGFSNLDSPNQGSSYDRMLYLDAQGRIALYNYNGSEFRLTTPNSYRDGLSHTLVVRLGANRTTAIFIDGVKVAESDTTGAASYSGYWKVGWSAFVGLANGITMQGAAIIHDALTDAQIATIHPAV